MRLGIRLQLLFALGALMVLAFVPLFFAVASLTRATMGGAREASARALGRAIAGHIVAARATRTREELALLLEAQVDAWGAGSPEGAPRRAPRVGLDGAAAVGVYDAAGVLTMAAGDPVSTDALPRAVSSGAEELLSIRTARGAALLVVVPEVARGVLGPPPAPGDGLGSTVGAPGRGAAPSASIPGSVAVLIPTDPSTVQATPLVRLVALYTGIVALALLVFAYFSMTRLVVRPIDELSRAARRVAEGARHLDVPRTGARELAQLGASVALMTGRLRADEEALRAKIDEIERYAADLKRAQERLVRSERLASVGRLAAGLAHEIGNPIAAILGFQELLLSGGLTPAEERDFLERMKRETERIHKILRDLLDFARPGSATGAPGRQAAPYATNPGSTEAAAGEAQEAGSVAEAVDAVLALVSPQRSFRGVEVVRELAPDVPRVPLSQERLVQVLLNLLLNAADAVPESGGRIVVRAMRTEDGSARIEVEDNGAGIAPEIRDQLFEPFATTKDVGKGTGLGLAVCRGLVEAAGGTIGADEVAATGAMADAPRDAGARFVLVLPGAPEAFDLS